MLADVSDAPRPPHPSVYLFLIVPFGAIGGFFGIAVAYLLSQSGVSTTQIAGLIALAYLPHTWKFLWAPIVDTTLTRKRWYMIAAVISALGIYATGAVSANAASLPLLAFIVLASNFAASFLGPAVESLMAYGSPDEQKGRASGWFQAGNLGGVGVGGGAGLWMVERLPEPWMAGAILAVACLLCAAPLLFVPEPPIERGEGHIGRRLAFVAKDLWTVARMRTGWLALLIVFIPLGTGAASNLWPAVADDWHASADTVALITGVLSGVIAAVGCIAGGQVCDRMDRKWAYALFGMGQALCAVAMALAPRTEVAFAVFVSLYAFIQGLTYAGFSAVVLEAIGRGAAATKYSVFASLSNTPIAYMTMVNGWGHERWGVAGLLYAEAVCALAALVLFALVAVSTRRPQLAVA